MRKAIGQCSNNIVITGDTGVLTITRIDGKEVKVLFDAADEFKVRRYYPWGVLTGNGGMYIRHTFWRTKSVILLHRLIADTPDHLNCDILNGVNTDCRRANLKNVDTYQLRSTSKRAVHLPPSGHVGITYIQDEFDRFRAWRANYYESETGKVHYIGQCETIDGAVRMRNEWMSERGLVDRLITQNISSSRAIQCI